MQNAIGLVVACFCGFTAALLFRNYSNASITEELRTIRSQLEELSRTVSSAPPGRANCAAVVDADSIRTELRQALDAGCACDSDDKESSSDEEPSSESSSEKESAAPAPSREAVTALERGHDLVAQAKAKGIWGDEQANALRVLFSQLDKNGQEELLHELIPAINEGQLRVETSGPPF